MACIETFQEFPVDPGWRGSWNELVAASTRPNVFLTWEWLTAWWEAFGRGRILHLVTVREGDVLLAVAPLYVARIPLFPGVVIRQLRFVGDGGPTFPENLGPVVRAGSLDRAIEALGGHLAGVGCRWDCFRFADVAPDDEATNELARHLSAGSPSLESPGAVCPFLTLPGSYDELLLGLSGHGRQRERRLARVARKRFDVRLELVDSPGEVDAALGDVVRLNTSARSRKNESSPFAQEAYSRFHREVMGRFLANGWLRLYFLRLDGVRVAFQYGFAFDRKYYDFQSGFDAAYQEHNPGDVLLQLVIEDVIEGGAAEFDFLRGDHAYKRKFAKQARETRTIQVTRRRGVVYLAGLGRELLSKATRGIRRGKETNAARHA